MLCVDGGRGNIRQGNISSQPRLLDLLGELEENTSTWAPSRLKESAGVCRGSLGLQVVREKLTGGQA